MKKLKEKQTVDLLALSQKERVRLCKEIHNILQQRIIEEKDLQRKSGTETKSYKNRETSTRNTESYLTKLKSCQVWSLV